MACPPLPRRPGGYLPDYYSRLPREVEIPGLIVNEALECMAALVKRLEPDQSWSTRDLVAQFEHCMRVFAHCIHETPSAR